MSNFYCWCALSLRTNEWKMEVSILINGWVTANYSVSRPPFCSPYWNLWSDLYKALTGYVRCHLRNLKTKLTSLYQTIFYDVHKRGTHTHTMIAIGEMQCVAFCLQIIIKMVYKLYSTQYPSSRLSLRDISLTNHSQSLDCLSQSDQSQVAIRLCTAYDMLLRASGLKHQTIFGGTIFDFVTCKGSWYSHS